MFDIIKSSVKQYWGLCPLMAWKAFLILGTVSPHGLEGLPDINNVSIIGDIQ